MQKPLKKIVFAAGGTGGHLFPAQALATQLLQENPSFTLCFMGSALSQNPYFDQARFAFFDVKSTTPFSGGPFKALQSVGILVRGIWQSLKLLKKENPSVVVGFGSFHAFPIICAAVIKKIPLVLFESNAIPGKVVRLFSKKAHLTGVYFLEAREFLKGNVVEVDIPNQRNPHQKSLSKEEARAHFHLSPHLITLLVFGGSQGAKKINQIILETLPLLKKGNLAFQLLHFTGSDETALDVLALCKHLDIPCYIKKFEKEMQTAWSAADLVICRSGAMTLSELIHHEVPGILIPYPAASDGHQLKNAAVLENSVKGAIYKREELLTKEILSSELLDLMQPHSIRREEMKIAIKKFKSGQKRDDLSALIAHLVQHHDS